MMRLQLHSRRCFVRLGAAFVSGISVQGMDGNLANLSGPRIAMADEPPEKPQSAPKNHALLVGVSRYEHAEMNRKQLKFPEDDALAIGNVLEQSGYAVQQRLRMAKQ